MLLKELTNNEFNSFKNSFNSSSLYQSIAYKNVMEKEGFNTILLGLVDNDNILAASLIIILKSGKIKYGYAPRGFLIDYNNHELLRIFTKEIKKYLSKKNVAAIKLCPNIIKSVNDTKYNIINHNNYYDNIIYNLNNLGYKHLGYNNHFEGLKPRFEAIIDLDSPYYILFKNIKKEYRTKIRSAEKKGINIFKGNINNLNDLYEQIKNKYPRKMEYFNNIYKEFDKDNNIELFYSKLDTKYYLNLIQKKYHKQEEVCNYYNSIISGNINEKNISKKMEADKLLNKYKKEIIKATKYLKEYPNGIITSTILIIKNKEEIYMLMDGYDSKFKSFNSKHLLIWKLIEMYSNQGFKKFNLGGITNPNIDSKYKGLNEFKLNFNALCYEYIGDLELVCNETLYFIYKNVPLKGILKI